MRRLDSKLAGLNDLWTTLLIHEYYIDINLNKYSIRKDMFVYNVGHIYECLDNNGYI